MNPQLLRVTNRIIERSRETRSAYLARIEQAKTSTVHRSQLACGNLAHGFALGRRFSSHDEPDEGRSAD